MICHAKKDVDMHIDMCIWYRYMCMIEGGEDP